MLFELLASFQPEVAMMPLPPLDGGIVDAYASKRDDERQKTGVRSYG